MSAYILLTGAFLIWFCFGTVGLFALFLGADALPPFLRRLLEPNRPSSSRLAPAGRLLVAAIWLALIGTPQLILARDVIAGDLAPLETGLALAEFGLCALWVAFLGWYSRFARR